MLSMLFLSPLYLALSSLALSSSNVYLYGQGPFCGWEY